MQTLTVPAINPLLKFIADPRYRWLRHTLFIGMGLVLAFKGDMEMTRQLQVSQKAREAIFLADALMFVFILSMLYFTMYILIPRLLFRSKLVLFLVSSLAIVLLIYFFLFLLEMLLLKPVLPPNAVYQFTDLSITDLVQKGLVISVLLGCVTGLKVFKKWLNDVQRMNEIQQINLRTELEQLKSQINPHFLFNTLNNLLVLTKTDPDKASQVLLGLSDLLRYQLYDSAREKIMLSKDIAFINNLLSLEKIRKDDFDFEVHTEGAVDGVSLPPFLFIPFVENAIKHGASTVGHSYLKLNFRINGNQLYFYSENSKPAVRHQVQGGIGLNNIKRRLELLYPDNHQLQITDDDNKYIVQLTIPLL